MQDDELFFLHFYNAAHEHGSAFIGEVGNSVMKIITEGSIDIGGETRLIDAFLFVDDGSVSVFWFAFALSAGVRVGLPLLLLRVTNSH